MDKQPKLYYTVTQEQWDEFVKRVKGVVEGAFHTNDMSSGEAEDDLCFAVDHLAKGAGLPEVNWEEAGEQ